MDQGAYLAELDRWAAATARLKDHPEEAPALRKDLPPAWIVTTGAERFEVPTTWLRASLQSLDGNTQRAGDYSKEIAAQLAARRTEATALAQPATIDVATARARLDEILSRREFRGVRGPDWFDRLRVRVGAWLVDLLEKVLGRLPVPAGTGRALGWVGLITAVVVFLIWLVRAALVRPAGLALERAAPLPAERTWQDWARQAALAAQGARYRDAIRFAYISALYRLEELGVWKVDRARTHREYLRLLSEDRAERVPLAALTSAFERVWYGGQDAAAPDFQSVIENLEKLGCTFPWNRVTANS